MPIPKRCTVTVGKALALVGHLGEFEVVELGELGPDAHPTVLRGTLDARSYHAAAESLGKAVHVFFKGQDRPLRGILTTISTEVSGAHLEVYMLEDLTIPRTCNSRFTLNDVVTFTCLLDEGHEGAHQAQAKITWSIT